jgi:predicted transcriptional regulator
MSNNAGMMHPLKRYRTSIGLSACEFAAKVGVSNVSIHRIEAGKQTPSLSLIARIISATGGALSANDFLPLKQSEAA